MIHDIEELDFPKLEGKQYATLSHATVRHIDMGEKTIEAQIKIDGEIVPDFSNAWSVVFRGEKYIMPIREPAGSKDNTSLNATIDMVFQHWAIYQLKRWPFVTMQAIDTDTAVPDEEVADLQLNLRDLCELFGRELKYYYADTITIDLNPDWESADNPTIISISHKLLWEVLVDVFHSKYGVRWSIEPREDNDNTTEGGERYVIKIGYPTTEVDHIFEYGYKGGLLKIERQVQNEDIRNMIKGRGGEQNIPRFYFKHSDDETSWRSDPDWIEELATVPFTNLHGATYRSYVQGWKAAHIDKYPGYTAVGSDNAYSPWAYQKGFTDTKFRPVEFVADEIIINPSDNDRQIAILPDFSPYVKKGSSLDKYGPLQITLDNNEDIYPTLQGTGLDVAVDVEHILSDDVEGSANNDAIVSNVGGVKSTVTRLSPSKRASVLLTGPRFTVERGRTANFSAETSILKVIAVGSGERKDIASLAEIESASVVVRNATTDAVLPASGIPSGTYYYTIDVTVHNLTTDKTLNVTVGTESPRVESATLPDKWRNTFEIWVKNIWGSSKYQSETDSQYADRIWKPILGDREQNTAKVVFTTGDLAHEDYEFVITETPAYDTSKSLNGAPSHWRLRLAKSDAELEATGLYIPSTKKQGKAGDTFVFIGVEMTHIPYVTEAEIRIDDWKKDGLREKKEIMPTYVVTTDRIRLNNEGKSGALIDQMRIGNSIRLADKRFIAAAYETYYLQSVTYTYREPTSDDAALNPDVEIVLSDDYATTGSALSVMQGEISDIQRQVGSISNIEQIVRAIGDSLYLRKDGISDRSLSPTQFVSLLTSGDFRSGLVGGAGWGIFKDDNGNWVVETDRLNVRQDMTVNTLVINQAQGRGGMEIDTAALMEVTRVIDTDEGYVCYFDQKDGSVANLFHVDDVAFCNRWTPENAELKFYKRRVMAVSADSITLTKGYESVELEDGTIDRGYNGSGIPSEGDNIIHFGNYSDRQRQYVKVRDVVGGGYERYIEGLDSVNAAGREYYFVGRQSGMYNGRPRWYIGDDNGFIEWINGVLTVKGRIHTLSTIGGKTVDKYVNDAAQSAADKAKAELQADIDELQRQVDGVLEAFNGQGAPTLNNYPANGWTTDEERKRHDKDIYTDITPYVDNATTPTSGQSWKWYYTSPTDYGWVKIADSEAVRALQLAQMSVRDTDVLYISHTSQTTPPALPTVNADGAITDLKGWSTTAPAYDATKFIWQTTYVRKGDGDASFSEPTCISGYNGKDGAQGVGIERIVEEYYLSTSRTELLGGTWSETRPTWVAGRFYWTRSHIYYTDGTDETVGEICVTGEQAPNLVIQYSAAGTSWHPDYRDGDMYMRTSNDGGKTWSTASKFIGDDGANGQDGKWRKFQWAKNNSPTTPPTSGWQDTPMNAAAGEYVWMRSGLVVPPASNPASWEAATRLTGDKGSDGQSTYMLDLSNEVSGIICDAAGTVTGTYPTSQASVYRGGTKITSGITYSIVGRVGIATASINSSGLVTMSGITADTATITVQAVVGGITLQSTINLYKIKPGSNGKNYAANLLSDSNKLQNSSTSKFIGNYAWDARPAVGTECTMTVCAKVGAKDNWIDIYQNWGSTRVGIFDAKTESVISIKFTIADATSSQPQIGFYRRQEDGDYDADTYVKWAVVTLGDTPQTSWTPSTSEMEGAVLYSLRPSVDSVSRDATGKPSVASVTATKYVAKADKLSTTTEQYLYYRIDSTTGSTAWALGASVGSVSTGAINIGTDTTAVVFELRDSAGTVLDRERVPVLTDATGLAVGGTNLLRNTDFIDGLRYWDNNFVKNPPCVTIPDRDTDVVGWYGGRLSVKVSYLTGTSTWRKLYQALPLGRIEPGKTYTLSGYVYIPDLSAITGNFTARMGYTIVDEAHPEGQLADVVVIDLKTSPEGKWCYVSGLWTSPTNMDKSQPVNLVFYITKNGEYYLNGWKLEEGNVATAWSEAPEDVSYLRSALHQSVTLDGGLVAATLLRLGITEQNGEFKVTAGMNGSTEANGEQSIAFWAGGDAVDAALHGDNVPAKVVIRHNGTAYFCDNTVRLDASRMEIGEVGSGKSVILDKEGLKLIDGNEQRLRVVHQSVGTLESAASAQLVSLNENIAIRLRQSRGTNLGTGLSWTGTTRLVEGFTRTFSIGNGSLPVGATINLTAKVKFDLPCIEENADGEMEGFPLIGVSARLRVYIPGGEAIIDRTEPVDYDGDLWRNHQAVISANISLTKAGVYRGELSLIGDGTTEGPTYEMKVASASATVDGKVQLGFADQTVLGNDGFMSIWGDTAALVNADGAHFKAGRYELLVTPTGIFKRVNGVQTSL